MSAGGRIPEGGTLRNISRLVRQKWMSQNYTKAEKFGNQNCLVPGVGRGGGCRHFHRHSAEHEQNLVKNDVPKR